MPNSEAATMNISRKNGTAVVSLAGDWLAQRGLPGIEFLESNLKEKPVKALQFDASQLARWDSGLLAFLLASNNLCERLQIEFKDETLPDGVRKLIRLS